MSREKLELFSGNNTVEIVDLKWLKVNRRMVLSRGGTGYENELKHFVNILLGGRVDGNQLETLSTSWQSLKVSGIIRGIIVDKQLLEP